MFKWVYVSLLRAILCHAVVGGNLCTASPPSEKIGEVGFFFGGEEAAVQFYGSLVKVAFRRF